MDLILPEHATRLRTQFEDESVDQAPLVKLFCPWGAAAWLLSGLTEDDALAFGLCDLGLGFPELGYVSLDELRGIKGPFGLTIERDLYFEPLATLTVYAEAARMAEGAVEDRASLEAAFVRLERRAKEDRRVLKARML